MVFFFFGFLVSFSLIKSYYNNNNNNKGLQNINYASSACRLRSHLQKSPVSSSVSLTPSDPSLRVYSWCLYTAPPSSLVLTLMVPWAWGALVRPHSCWQTVVPHCGRFHIRSGNWNKGEMKWKGVKELWVQRELRMGFPGIPAWEGMLMVAFLSVLSVLSPLR